MAGQGRVGKRNEILQARENGPGKLEGESRRERRWQAREWVEGERDSVRPDKR
jgi:hypothetical protein